MSTKCVNSENLPIHQVNTLAPRTLGENDTTDGDTQGGLSNNGWDWFEHIGQCARCAPPNWQLAAEKKEYTHART